MAEVNNIAFYRKYRPQTLTDFIGQDSVRTLLQNASLGKYSHAYLFCGPRGLGKTSAARLLAKIVNCITEKKDEGSSVPCNICDSCLSITDGSNLDLIEIDAASNRGIDDIRELRERIKLAPSMAKKKIYIIDEVHMLTNEAFNALLKTLEEPPAHVMFILATTESQKIPSTILSRVQKLDFKLATEAELLQSLKHVTEEEQIKFDEDALLLIVRKAEGSFRDCLKLLDQVSASGQVLTLAYVEESLKSSKSESLSELIEALSKKDATAALQNIQKQSELGVNQKELAQSLMELLRGILLIKNGAESVAVISLGAQNSQIAKQFAPSFETEQVVRLLSLLIKSLEQMKVSPIAQLPLEIAVVEACTQSSVYVEKGIEATLPISNVPVLTKPLSEPLDPNAKEGIEEEILTVNEAGAADDVSSGDLFIIKDKWTYILETIKPYNFSLEAMLKQIKIVSCDEGLMVLEVPYSFHQRILEAPKSRDLLESVLSDVLGKQMRVGTVLGQRPVRIEELANVELAADDEIVNLAAEIFSSE